MKRKLIEVNQDILITCDNPHCDFVVENETKDPNADTSLYINMPCPLCGENLLTEEDSKQFERLMQGINWINKWFSWVMFFVSKNAKSEKKLVHVHKGINVKDS